MCHDPSRVDLSVDGVISFALCLRKKGEYSQGSL